MLNSSLKCNNSSDGFKAHNQNAQRKHEGTYFRPGDVQLAGHVAATVTPLSEKKSGPVRLSDGESEVGAGCAVCLHYNPFDIIGTNITEGMKS